MSILYLEASAPPHFPDPATAIPEGLCAVGGDLSVERLCLAYDLGIFPWYSETELPQWWSPDPRAVLEPDTLHVSRSLRRVLARSDFELSFDRAFERVIRECGRRRAEGSWIHPEVIVAYTALHDLGHAHSVEVWDGDDLAGGIYGVQRGALFAAESMFFRRSNASKIALVACLRSLTRAGIELFDVQFTTAHLASMGTTLWPRARYLARLAEVRGKRVELSGVEVDWRSRP